MFIFKSFVRKARVVKNFENSTQRVWRYAFVSLTMSLPYLVKMADIQELDNNNNNDVTKGRDKTLWVREYVSVDAHHKVK